MARKAAIAGLTKQLVDYQKGALKGKIAGDPVAAVRAVPAHDGWLRALAVSPDGTKLATCGNDRLVKVWTVADGMVAETPAAIGTGHESHVYEVAWKPDGSGLAGDPDLPPPPKGATPQDGELFRQGLGDRFQLAMHQGADGGGAGKDRPDHGVTQAG